MKKGRPRRDTVEYYPHFVNHDTAMVILERYFANDGYALWHKTLELLGKTDGHALRLSEPILWQHYCVYCHVTEELALRILDLLANLGAIDKDLWQANRIIWCQLFVDNIAQVYEQNRQRPTPSKPGEKAPQGNPPQGKFPSEEGYIPGGKSDKGERSISDETEEQNKGERVEHPTDTGYSLASSASSVPGQPGADPNDGYESEELKLYGETVRMKPSDYDAFFKSEGEDVTVQMIKILDDRRLASAEWLANKATCAPGEWPTRGTYGYADDARAMASSEWCIPVARKLVKSKGSTGNAGSVPGKRRSSGSALLDKVEESIRTGKLKV